MRGSSASANDSAIARGGTRTGSTAGSASPTSRARSSVAAPIAASRTIRAPAGIRAATASTAFALVSTTQSNVANVPSAASSAAKLEGGPTSSTGADIVRAPSPSRQSRNPETWPFGRRISTRGPLPAARPTAPRTWPSATVDHKSPMRLVYGHRRRSGSPRSAVTFLAAQGRAPRAASPPSETP